MRRFGRRILPQSRFRTVLNRLLLGVEQKRGAQYTIDGHALRFAPDSTPHEGGANASDHERYDAIQLEKFARSIKPGDWIADVGAYRGEYAVVAAHRAGSEGRVFAFEPTAANARFIHRNAELNHLSNRITIAENVVADANGAVTFYRAGNSTTNSMFRSSVQNENSGPLQQDTYEAVTLDSYFEKLGRLPDVVKIDVEGAEWRALRGAQRIVESNAVIFCELHPWGWSEAGDSADEMREWLRARGRTIIDAVTGEPVTEWKYGPTLLQRVA